MTTVTGGMTMGGRTMARGRKRQQHHHHPQRTNHSTIVRMFKSEKVVTFAIRLRTIEKVSKFEIAVAKLKETL